jgi:hypothetical protein
MSTGVPLLHSRQRSASTAAPRLVTAARWSNRWVVWWAAGLLCGGLVGLLLAVAGTVQRRRPARLRGKVVLAAAAAQAVTAGYFAMVTFLPTR